MEERITPHGSVADTVSGDTVARGTPQRAAVITPHRVFYGDGTVADTRPGLVADVAGILAGCDRMTHECTIVLDGVPLDTLRATDVPAGWKFNTLRAWTTLRRGTRVVALGVRAAMDDKHIDVLFGADTEPGTVALLLDRYHRLTGGTWRGTPAMSSLSLLRSTWGNPQHQPLWRDMGTAETGAFNVGALRWSRPLNEWEATWGYVHTFDANSAYLGSAGSVELAWSALAHTGAREFDKRRPGYWLVDPSSSSIDLDSEPGRPPLLPRGDGPVWMTTPYAALLAELGDPVRVLDSWTGDEGVRVLKGWQRRLRDARLVAEAMPTGGLRDALIRAVKRTATDTIGAMARVDGGGMIVARRDWSHTLIDLWRANMYRRMVTVHASEGVWPCAVHIDAVSYADVCDQLDCRHMLNDGGRHHPGAGNLAAAIRVRPGMGGWKHTGAVTTAQWVADHPQVFNWMADFYEALRPGAPKTPAKPRSSFMMEVWDA